MEAYLSDCSDPRGERKRLKHIDEYGEAQFSSLEINMEAEIKEIMEKTLSEIKKKEANNLRRRTQIEQLFELWDVDGSGYLEINEIEMVLSKWRKEHTIDRLLEQVRDVFEDVFSKITKKSFEQMIAKVCNVFPNEDVFDSLI